MSVIAMERARPIMRDRVDRVLAAITARLMAGQIEPSLQEMAEEVRCTPNQVRDALQALVIDKKLRRIEMPPPWHKHHPRYRYLLIARGDAIRRQA